MAANLQGRSARRGASRRASHRPMSEINVTPFVDVMLVLLVIFMVTAPLLTVGVEVNLPKTKAGAVSGSDEPLAVTINAAGDIYLQDTLVELKTLVPRLQAITGENPDARIFIRGDSNIDYGRVMQVMGTINTAGYSRVALITSQPDPDKTRTKAKTSGDESASPEEGQ